ncbi:MAG: UDP-N-acetylenolpyruvoylglucosamine reductase [Parcubacteria group bacterium RIFCSPHIGHO2_01_FULL_56_18]|nr:MAG: UDP-N-acetylenolpyruvoylglucosamine reductase [Parcubacteria group bacterium RIFCSPHIGHO2_01_FULL_56_18]
MLNIQQNKPLSDLTTFEIGGPAKYYVEVKNEEEIRNALGWAREHGENIFVMGGGSNLLVPDEGFDGLVIHIVSNQFNFSGDILEADAGCNLLHLIRAASEQGLGGWEKLGGIPGTIGGAVRGNAGAFRPEIKDFLVYTHAINTKTEDTHEFANAECEFAYRQSYFKRQPEWIITKVHIKLGKVEPSESKKLIEATIREREKRHIQNVRAAGSYFMNPVAPVHVVSMFEQEKGVESRGGRVPAGWLIEKAGLKGARLGGAQSSEQHPNYLVNMGNAKASEVRELADRIKRTVKEKFDVQLEEEAVILTSR